MISRIEHLPTAVTGVGSLPHCDPDDALEFMECWAPELPFSPQLPGFQKRERMLDQVLAGMDPRELARMHANECLHWLRDQPVTESVSWTSELFLYRLRDAETPPPGRFAKIQVAGPATALSCLRTADGPILGHMPLAETLSQRIELLAVFFASAVKRLGYRPIIQIDEPALVEGGEIGLEYLRETIESLSEQGYVTMLHCCDRIEAGHSFFRSGADILSFDMAMHYPTPSMVSALQEHFDRGGAIAWGVVPTDPGGTLDAQRHLDHSVGWWRRMRRVNLASRSLVTPACGLAHHRLENCPAIMDCCRLCAEALRSL